MTDDNAVWRDEEKLPLSELTRAMATWDTDGQHDDETGNDAGAEQAFGHDALVHENPPPDATDPERPARPGTTFRTGPH
jgi:hypothetical protein